MAAHMEHQHAHSGCEQMKQQLVHQPQLVVRLVTSLAGRNTNHQTVSLRFTSICISVALHSSSFGQGPHCGAVKLQFYPREATLTLCLSLYCHHSHIRSHILIHLKKEMKTGEKNVRNFWGNKRKERCKIDLRAM